MGQEIKKQDNSAAVELGRRLKVLRVERGIMAKDLCEQIGMKTSTLSNIENGKWNTGIKQLQDIARALGAHIDVVKD